VVLDDGRVAGTGTHAELMDSNSTYREIVLSQLSAQEAAA
jgi:ATP-binding cassette subfamily B protein